MDVGLPADGLRVAQSTGHPAHRLRHVPLRFGFRLEPGESCQCLRGEHSPRPRTKVLGGELVAADLAQVSVHVIRTNRLSRAVRVDVLEELVSREIAAGLDDACETGVLKIDRMRDPAFAAEFEADLRTANLGMAIAHRRQPDRAVGARVLLVADADECFLEQLDGRGEDLFARKPFLAKVRRGAPPNAPERLRKRRQAAVLELVAHLPESRVIPILLTAARVAAGGLQMASRLGANPDFSPRWRNDERLDAGEIGAAHLSTIGMEV